jgi:hypothetical protein
MAYFINPCHKSVCISVSLLLLLGKGFIKCIPPFVAWQRLCKHVPAAMNTCKNWRIVECVIFYVVYVLSKECLWVCVSPCCCYVNSVNMFLWQWRIVGGIVFYVVHAISKESSQSVLPRTSCFYNCNSSCSVLACMNVTLLLFIRFSPALYICTYVCMYVSVCLYGTKCIRNESALFQNLYFSKHIKSSDMIKLMVLLLTWIWKVLLISYEASKYILWHVDPLLGNDHEISNYITAIAR